VEKTKLQVIVLYPLRRTISRVENRFQKETDHLQVNFCTQMTQIIKICADNKVKLNK